MYSLALLLLLISFNSLAVEKEISGNLEVQGRHVWNNEEAKDLFQNWDEENFFLAYGNLSGKLEFKNSRLEANWFNRYSTSDLYEDDYFATRLYTFPQVLVARDLFKLQYQHQQDDYYSESILNKFLWEKDFQGHRITLGRMYINYGLGEIFNPINPFNQPTALTSISQVAQGNDGANFKYFLNDTHTIDFFLLGDKRFQEYEGEITKTIWVHGEVLPTDKLQVDYVLGEDLKRYKAGTQISYNFEEALLFLQALYQTRYLNNQSSSHLWDVNLGYDQQVTSKWHVRIEAGYQRANPFQPINNFSERFLPTEYFIALANQYEIHPLVNLSGIVVNDIKSGFTYLIAKSTFNLGHDLEADIFGYLPAAKGDSIENPAQKLITTDIGAALRAFF